MLYRVSRAIVRFLMALLYPFKSDGEGPLFRGGSCGLMFQSYQ